MPTIDQKYEMDEKMLNRIEEQMGNGNDDMMLALTWSIFGHLKTIERVIDKNPLIWLGCAIRDNPAVVAIITFFILTAFSVLDERALIMSALETIGVDTGFISTPTP